MTLSLLDKAAALEIAHARADEKEWSLEEPIEVVEHHGWFRRKPSSFSIMTNAGRPGPRAFFKVDARTGAIVDESYVSAAGHGVIDREDAVEIARRYAEEDGWTVDDPKIAAEMGLEAD